MIDSHGGLRNEVKKVEPIKEFMVDQDGKRMAIQLTTTEKQQLIEDLNITQNKIQKEQIITDQSKNIDQKNA